MATQKQGRAAAWAAAAILVVVAGVQFFWELYEVLGADPPSASDQFSIVFIGVVALWVAVVLLVRVGYWPKLARFAVVRINAWVIVAISFGGAVDRFAGPTDFDRFVAGPINLIIALLAVVVARSELPESLRNGGSADAERQARSPNPHSLHRPVVAPVPAATAAALTTSRRRTA